MCFVFVCHLGVVCIGVSAHLSMCYVSEQIRNLFCWELEASSGVHCPIICVRVGREKQEPVALGHILDQSFLVPLHTPFLESPLQESLRKPCFYVRWSHYGVWCDAHSLYSIDAVFCISFEY